MTSENKETKFEKILKQYRQLVAEIETCNKTLQAIRSGTIEGTPEQLEDLKAQAEAAKAQAEILLEEACATLKLICDLLGL